jgi:hypothetical protein
MQRNAAVGFLVIGTVLAAAELLLFDWDPRDMAVGAILGTAAWGTFAYLTNTGKVVPRGALQEAPHDVAVEPRQVNLSSDYWLIGVSAVCIPVAWLLDRLEVGAAVIPGHPFGWAAASLLALVQIRRWEMATGRSVLFDPDGEELRPYAGPPL